jgi:phosphatidate cytidylyltransferase
MVFLVLLSIYLNHWMFAAILLLVVILGLLEFYNLTDSEKIKPQKAFGVISGIIWFSASTVIAYTGGPYDLIYLAMLIIPLIFLPFIFEIFSGKQNPIENIAVTLFGFFYIAFPLSLLVFLFQPGSTLFLGMPVWLLGFFLLVWIYDTSAYLFGVRFGKTKFFERISPKKTWEGTISGAIIASMAAAGLYFLVGTIPWFDWLALLLIVLIFGTFGDLSESLFKRSLSIKDSGSILPGHGGILDRFDSVLLSAPFVFLYFLIRSGI